MSEVPNIDLLSKQSFQILRSFTVNVFQSYEDNLDKKPDAIVLNWIRNTQKILNEYIREVLRFEEQEMLVGINNQTFIKIQDNIILERLKKIPKRQLPVSNLLYQKLIEAFSLHNQYLLDEWLFI
ncbi:MAG: hypothetical protein ACW981_17745 [Candidatus Hodarchaeales archaeon]|jgi:hypothetical protein